MQWELRCYVYTIGGKLVGKHTKRPPPFQLSQFLFADDAALIFTSRSDIFTAAKVFEEVTTEFGLTLTIPKTKLLVAGAHITTNDVPLLEFADGGMEVVKESKYVT